MTDEELALGMGRPITRRDFLNGIAVTGAGMYAAQAMPAYALDDPSLPPVVTPEYPPTNTGLRGNIASAVAEFPAINSGKYKTFPIAADSIAEEYDLVIVGAGISGLSAAYYYQNGLGTGQKILILDNHDDIGGHAKRNEFHIGDRTLLGYGGTMSIATPFPYSYGAKALVADLGIQVSRASEFANRTIETKYKLGSATFYDKETFGVDKLVIGGGGGRRGGGGSLDDIPISAAAKADLTRIYGKNPDYMLGMTVDQKIEKLKHMSYLDYLQKVAKISPEACLMFRGTSFRNNKFADTCPAYEAAVHGAQGFNGLGLPNERQFSEGAWSIHFPDGNATVARLLVGKIVPSAFPGPQTMDTVIKAKLDYTQLDKPGANLRIRLGSPVVRVENVGDAASSKGVLIAYKKDGALQGVRAKYCIMACYNAILPSLIPEIPLKQKEALNYSVKVPMLYTNVVVKRWTAFQKLGISRVTAQGFWYPGFSIDVGTTVGGYDGSGDPEGPIVVHMNKSPNKPGVGLSRKEQNRAGQQELLAMSFADHEMHIRKMFQRILGPAGFDPAEDIAAITVNRWPYGYAYTYDTLGDPDVPQEQRPHVIGRQRIGRIAIANSDAGAAAFTNQAMDEANRAVEELYVLQGLC